jgi:F-type H+-transporting ATPase subunit epsilon
VESAEFGHDIDVDRAMRARERAERRISQAESQTEKINRVRAEAALQRSIARIRTAELSKQ